MAPAMAAPPPLVLRYGVVPRPEVWELIEEPAPHSPLHDQAIELLRQLITAWALREGRAPLIARNLALRWEPGRPRVGLEPDLALYDPAPPGGEMLSGVATWEFAHAPPKVAVEIINPAHPYKDYVDIPVRYAASGTNELWVFDPLLAGPQSHGGPYRVQVWARAAGAFERIYAGEGPALSPHLGAWLVTVDAGRRLRLSGDEAGVSLWPTGEEAALLAKEAERVAKEEALAHVARLEAELGALRRVGR